MRKKFLAGLVLAFLLCNCAYASDWKSYFKVDWDEVGNYATEKWNDASNYVSGLFTSKSKDIKVSSDETLPPEIAQNWDKLTGSLTDALTLRDKNEKLPRNSWIPFKEDQRSNNKKINALLDAALSILVNGEAGTMRREASALRDKLENFRLELDDLRNKRINAPESSYLPWRLTRDKADRRIAELQEEIQVCEENLKVINSKLTASLKEIGLELTEDQTDILLNSVTGDDLLQNTVVFANVKAVVEKLEQLAQNETNSLEITRRYTGLYLVLNDLLIHTQEEFINKIDGEYKTKLNAIINEAETLRKDALNKSNQNIYSDAQRKSFASNAQANAMTVKVANLYIELLNSQREGTLNSLKSLRLNRDLAENTYKTVRSSGELRGLIHSGLKLFDAVDALKMPELKVFESGVMRLEFEEINRRLRKD